MSSMYGATGGGNKAPSGYNVGRLQNFSPEQMSLFKSLFSHLSPDSSLSKMAGGDQSFFEEQEAPAMRQFAGLQGDLASRFSGMGTGARRSSGFQNTATQATSDFAQGLQSRRQELQRQAIKDLLGLSGDLLGQRTHEQFLTPKQPSFLQSLLGGLGQGVGQLGGMMGTGGMYKKFFGV